MKLKKENIPLFLTLSRLIISPLILPVLLVWLLPFNNIIFNCFLAVFFIALALTDFFDGYFARKYNVENELGEMLDPIADKFLVYATLIALLAAGKINYYWVILLIGREFFVMGLRLIAQQKGEKVFVSSIAKIKTVLQMVMLTYLIINPYQQYGTHSWWNGFEAALIAVTVLFSLVSAALYSKSFFPDILVHTTAEKNIDGE